MAVLPTLWSPASRARKLHRAAVQILGLVLASSLLAVDLPPPPYVIVTVTGSRVGALEKPTRSGKSAMFRAYPGGALSSLPATEIDWAATETLNVPKIPVTPTPVLPPPTPQLSLSKVAEGLRLDAPKPDAEDNWGKLKRADGTVSTVGGKGAYFGDASVAKSVTASPLRYDVAGCPKDRAEAHGTIRNVSKKKLRNLKVLVLARGSSGKRKEYVQPANPPDLPPGAEAKLDLSFGCDEIRVSDESPLVIADVSGLEEAEGATASPTPEPKPARPEPRGTPQR